MEKYDIFLEDQLSFDNNLYRLPTNITNIDALIGPAASRQDRLNTASLGADGETVIALQSIAFDVRIDSNRFDRNTNLNNTSGLAKLDWDWRIGSLLSGDVGANYTRTLAGFASTGYFGRDLVSRSEYFGDARYQIGPRWAVFGGISATDTSNSAPIESVNNQRTKAGDIGAELAGSVDKSFGFEYQFHDGHYADTETTLNGEPFDRDYRDNLTQLYLKYLVTEKTMVTASAGYLKRNYPNSNGIGAFSGNIWSATAEWQATDKSKLAFSASRNLQANFDAVSNYFVSQGGSITPTWIASEKLTLTSTFAWYDQNYIASSPSAIALGSRHDKLNYEELSAVYAPISALIFNLSYRNEQRQSNQPIFRYRDNLAIVGVIFKFLL